ncbi:MAG: FkbM family methyltransferase [Hyphomonadaceae bacterium]
MSVETASAEKIFVDVGAHNGGSIHSVIEGGYAFDRMVSVEPDPEMITALEKRFAKEIAEGRYRIAPVGLSDHIGAAQLMGDNTEGGASMIAGKFGAGAGNVREIKLIDWATFLDDYGLRRARLWVKINAEGAEIAILDSILAEGGRNIESLVVFFDIVKSPFGAWKKWRVMRDLAHAGIPYLLAENVLIKHGPRKRLNNWLSSFAALNTPPVPADPPPLSKLIRMHYLDACSALGLRLTLFKRRT